MRFSTTFKLASRKGIVEKIKELVNPVANSLDVHVEISYEVSAEELKELYELYREYRSEIDSSSKDVSSFLEQISKIWEAVKNGIHDFLKEVVDVEDVVFDVQNAIHRLRKNARENESEFRVYTMKLAKEEKDAEKEINDEKTEN